MTTFLVIAPSPRRKRTVTDPSQNAFVVCRTPSATETVRTIGEIMRLSFLAITTVFLSAIPVHANAQAFSLLCYSRTTCNDECVAGCSAATPDTACREGCARNCAEQASACPSSYLFCKYNTFAADNVYLELTANTLTAEENIRTQVTYIDSSGTFVKRINTILRGFARQDFDVMGAVGRNKIGQIVIGLYDPRPVLTSAVSFYRTIGGGLHQTAYMTCSERSAKEVQPVNWQVYN